MKHLITIALLLLSGLVNAQKIIQRTPGTSTVEDVRLSTKLNLLIPRYADTTEANFSGNIGLDSAGAIIYTRNNQLTWMRSANPKKWNSIGGGGGGGGTIPAGAISSLPTIGFNPGSNITSNDFITTVFYQSQPPLATLTGGGTYEYTTAGNTNRTLSWTATRQTATATLATIVVDGVTQTFTQPAQGGTVSNNKTAIVPHNTNTTYSNLVTTTDGKTATATTSFIYQNKIYAGFVTSATPTDADIIAATGSSYVGGQFSGSRNQSGTLTIPSSSKYFIFVSPASYGTPNIVINGLGATLNQTTRNFTNASGAIISYIIAVSPFQTAGAIDSYIVN